MEIEIHFTEGEEKINGTYKNINCEYKINTTALNKNGTNEIYQEKDILNKFYNDKNGKYLEGLNSLLKNLNDKIIPSLSSIKEKSNISYSKQSIQKITNFIQNYPYIILGYLKNIERGRDSANYLKETSKGLLICGWTNKIVIYNNSTFEYENEVKIDNYNIFEINQDQSNENELIVSSNRNEDTKRLIIQKDSKYKLLNIKDKKTRICFQFKKNYIISNEEGLFLVNDLSSNITNSDESYENQISKISYWNGIKINGNIIAFTSNKILKNGEDEIIFYDYNIRKISYYIYHS